MTDERRETLNALAQALRQEAAFWRQEGDHNRADDCLKRARIAEKRLAA